MAGSARGVLGQPPALRLRPPCRRDPKPDDLTAPGDEVIIGYRFLNSRHHFGVKEPRDLTPGERYDTIRADRVEDDALPRKTAPALVLNNNDPKPLEDTMYVTSTGVRASRA